MLAPSHVIIGMLSTTIVAESLSQPLSAPAYLGAVAGSLLPNLDYGSNKMKQAICPLLVLAIYLLSLTVYPVLDFTPNKTLASYGWHIQAYFGTQQVITFAILMMALLIGLLWTGHRSISHSLAICMLLAIGLNPAGSGAMLGFAIGYISHVIIDLFTPQGVRFFYPHSQRISLRPKVARGSFSEGVVVLALALLGYLLSNQGQGFRRVIVKSITDHLPF